MALPEINLERTVVEASSNTTTVMVLRGLELKLRDTPELQVGT